MMANMYNYKLMTADGKMVNVKPIKLEDLGDAWWELEDWFIEYNGKRILTPAGELAALNVDIEELKMEIEDYSKSKKRQHKHHVRNIKQTVKFLTWVFKYCEKREIGTTGFYSLLATDNLEGDVDDEL